MTLRFADLEINPLRRECARAGIDLHLTAKEFELLLALLRRQGHVVPRHVLAREVWQHDPGRSTNVVEVTIQRLRRKLDKPFPRKLLHTVRGGGYVLSEDPWIRDYR